MFVLGLVLWFTIPWIVGLLTVSGERWAGPPPDAVMRDLTSIRRRLDTGEAQKMGIFPEGVLFSHSFYGFALINVAVQRPDDAAFRTHVLSELERLIPIAERLADDPPFHVCRGLVPKGGVIAAGHANLLRAGYALLGGQREDILQAYHAQSRVLSEAFRKSTVGSIETFPGMIWPVDNCCALESLRLHDGRYRTDYSAACRAWEVWMGDHLDTVTGMMVAQIDRDGRVLDRPRGCALSWSLAFMPGFAPDLARQQYGRYRDQWFIHTAGTTGIREWPPGQGARPDIDSGPVVGGIGAAASGLGIAAAKANGDTRDLTGLLRGMEFLGAPKRTFRGEKEYFLGAVLLTDVLAVWGRTVCVWDAPGEYAAAQDWPDPPLEGYWLVVSAACLGSALVMAVLGWSLCRAVSGVRRNPSRWRAVHVLVLCAECAVVIAWLAVPAVTLLYALILVSALEILDNRCAFRQWRRSRREADAVAAQSSAR